jgi:uncharacterized membrane protein YtjA (UPF0391 family)
MLRLALLFFVISLIAGALNFTGVAGAAGGIAQILFFTFLGLCVLALLAGLMLGRAIL